MTKATRSRGLPLGLWTFPQLTPWETRHTRKEELRTGVRPFSLPSIRHSTECVRPTEELHLPTPEAKSQSFGQQGPSRAGSRCRWPSVPRLLGLGGSYTQCCLPSLVMVRRVGWDWSLDGGMLSLQDRSGIAMREGQNSADMRRCQKDRGHDG